VSDPAPLGNRRDIFQLGTHVKVISTFCPQPRHLRSDVGDGGDTVISSVDASDGSSAVRRDASASRS
jgi:hypothetical protein